MREAYYDWRAPEYDDFWLQRRRYSGAPLSWFDQRDAVLELVAALPPMRTLDVACGTGFVTSRLRGNVTALDQSPRMIEIARRQAPDATLVQGSGLSLPFRDASFDRVFTSHFYGHLEEHERAPFLSEARRVAPELIVLDAGLHEGEPRDVWQDRELNDGTQWVVFKRFFSEAKLLDELGGGEVLFSGTWFICIRSVAG
jgi:SAM-dependent methyltransferase